jgi:hypothetical protein
MDVVEVWQDSSRVLAPPVQLRGDPLLLTPQQELGLQLGKAIERVAQQNLPGFAAEQGVEQGASGEGGGAGDGSREAFQHQQTATSLKFCTIL